ncbi:Protein F46C3.2 [Aphelenchoides avenae]|nr:Protein F46C3.2 [Aphelenchus avenae]
MMLKLNDDQQPSSSKHFAPSLAETDECSERQLEEGGCVAGSSDETEYVVDPPQRRVNDPIALREYIKSLSNEDIVKLLAPLKAGLFSEDTVLKLNSMNFSMDQMNFSVSAAELLEFLGPSWQKWVLCSGSDIPGDEAGHSVFYEHIRAGGHFESIDVPPTDFVTRFIDELSKRQKRAIVLCAKDGLLTDEAFLNVSTYLGPDRIQVSMKKVVEVLSEQERRILSKEYDRNFCMRLWHLSHYSSANFDQTKKSDLDVRHLRCGRQKLSFWYTVLFALMTLCTFLSHVWSNIVNFEEMNKMLSATVAIVTFAR